MLIENWPIDRPKDYPKNARKWSAQAVEKVAASIREYGWRQPVVVDAHEVIVIGHLRRAGGKFLGLTEVPVHVARDLTPAQIRGLRLADNRTNQESYWNDDLLGPELADLDALGFDLGLTGFDVHELDKLLRDPLDEERAEQAPPLPDVATTRPGDLWLLGNHRVMCGDATSAETVAGLLGERKPRLMVTDPPLRNQPGFRVEGSGRHQQARPGGSQLHEASDRRPHATPQSLPTRARTGLKRSRWFLASSRLRVACQQFTREVLAGLLADRVSLSSANHMEQRASRSHANALLVCRTSQLGTCERRTRHGTARPARTRRFGKSPSPKFIMGGSDEPKLIIRRRSRWS